MKALFVVNRRSGAKRRPDAAAIIREHCDFEFEIGESEKKEDLDDVIGNAVEKGAEAVFAVGGDGTVHEVAKRLIGTPTAAPTHIRAATRRTTRPTTPARLAPREMRMPISVRRAPTPYDTTP